MAEAPVIVLAGLASRVASSDFLIPSVKGVSDGTPSSLRPSSSLGIQKHLGVASVNVLSNTIDSPLGLSVEPHEIPRPEYERQWPTLDEESFRHSYWMPQRQRILAALQRTHQSAVRINGFVTCGACTSMQYSRIRKAYRLRGSHCHDRFCQPCARARAARVRRAVLSRVSADRLRFITLTLRHSDTPLVEQIRRIREAFKEMRHTKLWKSAVSGGAVFLECKVGRDGRWHPHLHVMAEGTWLDWRQLRASWHGITGDSDNVDVRQPKGNAAEAISGYLTQYVSKCGTDSVSKNASPSPLHDGLGAWTESALDEYVVSMKGQHTVDFLGNWRKWEAEDEAADEAVVDDWEYVGSLSALLRRARAGDPIANYLLFGLFSADTAVLAYRAARESPP